MYYVLFYYIFILCVSFSWCWGVKNWHLSSSIIQMYEGACSGQDVKYLWAVWAIFNKADLLYQKENLIHFLNVDECLICIFFFTVFDKACRLFEWFFDTGIVIFWCGDSYNYLYVQIKYRIFISSIILRFVYHYCRIVNAGSSIYNQCEDESFDKSLRTVLRFHSVYKLIMEFIFGNK